MLRYRPPGQTTPTVVTVGAGYFQGSYGADEDVVFVYPDEARQAALNITGGRHLRVIGGAGINSGGTLRLRQVTGSVFLQGLDLDLGHISADAINAHGVTTGPPTYPDIYLQDIRVTGVHGARAATHADIYQAQGPIGGLYVDQLTGHSNYQGLFLAPQWPTREAHLSRVDLHGDGGTGYLYWFRDNATQQPYLVTLDEVYADNADRGLTDLLVWPKAGLPDIGAADDHGAAIWPGATRIFGRIQAGCPSAGEFAPASAVGLGYVPPGYL